MSDRFAVGEVAWLLYSPEWPDDPMCQCTVTAPARLFRRSYSADGSFAWADFFLPQYEVVDEAGQEWCVGIKWLRKLRPPQDWVRICRLSERPVEEPA